MTKQFQKFMNDDTVRKTLGVIDFESFDDIFKRVFPLIENDRNTYRRGLNAAGRASEFLGANLEGRFFVMVNKDSEEMKLARVTLFIDGQYYRAVEVLRKSRVINQN